MKCKMSCLLLACLLSAGAVFAEEPALLRYDSNGIDIAKVEIVGQIEGQELTLGLSFEAETKSGEHRLLLMQGDAVLQKLDQAKRDYKLAYDQSQKAYYAVWTRAGRHQIDATFVAKPEFDPNSPWREARLEVPSGRMRSILLESVRAELEVDLPGGDARSASDSRRTCDYCRHHRARAAFGRALEAAGQTGRCEARIIEPGEYDC